jgi:hypothetical protein
VSLVAESVIISLLIIEASEFVTFKEKGIDLFEKSRKR